MSFDNFDRDFSNMMRTMAVTLPLIGFVLAMSGVGATGFVLWLLYKLAQYHGVVP